jgi:hypothetical protein
MAMRWSGMPMTLGRGGGLRRGEGEGGGGRVEPFDIRMRHNISTTKAKSYGSGSSGANT